MQNYCGPLIRTLPATYSLVKQKNGNYSAKNLYCKITILNLDPTQIINFNLTKLLPDRKDDFTLEILYIDGSKKYQIFNEIGTVKQDIAVTQYVFHYFSESESNSLPFIVDVNVRINDFSTTTLIGIIIAVVVGVILCVIGLILFFKCTRDIAEDRRRRFSLIQAVQNENAHLNTNQQPNSQQNVMSNQASATIQAQLEKTRSKLKKALQKLFETKLKPKKFDQSLNEFNSTECTICLEDFDVKSNVSTLLCKHVFHFECIVDWIKKQKGDLKCPNCNVKLIPDDLLNDSIDHLEIPDNIVLHNTNQRRQVDIPIITDDRLLLTNNNPANNNFIRGNDHAQPQIQSSGRTIVTDNIARGRSSTLSNLGQAIISQDTRNERVTNENIRRDRINSVRDQDSANRNLLNPQVNIARNIEMNSQAYRLNL